MPLAPDTTLPDILATIGAEDTKDGLPQKTIMYKILQIETPMRSLQTSDNFWHHGDKNYSKTWTGHPNRGLRKPQCRCMVDGGWMHGA